jgi:isovaleryl-CoA dehydrogenase
MSLSENWQELDLFHPSQTHQMLRKMVREFAQAELEPQAAKFDRSEGFNLPLFRKLGELGLLGISVPESYGGSAMDPVAVVIAHEELSAIDPGFCLAYLAHALLCVNNIAQNASEEQKKRFLPKLCDGSHIGAMAMSEPAVGTDVLGMQSSATQSGKNQPYLLNGRKMWITNGTIDDQNTPCDIVLVYALDSTVSKEKSISSFIVENGFEGFSVGQKIKDKLGMRASSTAELVFDNCKVPTANLVGEAGQSVKHMMRNLEIERVGLAAMSLGIARRSLEIMVQYANERTAFGKPLHRFGQIQKYIAESYAEYRAARCYVYETARKMDLGKVGQRLDTDGVKLIASKAGKEIADRAIQVLGGYGYVGEYTVERLWRDSKLLEIGGGTLEAHQKNIANDICGQAEKVIDF